jgi:BioD-like phosphotransacetylase family protein
MITLYITSTTPYAGKSALCVGLAKRFQRDGFKIGYMRPLTTSKTVIGECVVDEDAELMRQTLGLTDPMDTIWPVCLDPATVEAVLRGDGKDYAKAVKSAFAQVSRRKDIVILEAAAARAWRLTSPPTESLRCLMPRWWSLPSTTCPPSWWWTICWPTRRGWVTGCWASF